MTRTGLALCIVHCALRIPFAAALAAEVDSPSSMASRLEARMAAGDGVTLPDANAELAWFSGTVDLAEGDWPEAFVVRAGETVCVAVSPFTGCYEFFDTRGEVFWTIVPVLPTTENWVAPFRHAEEGSRSDDALYAPWRLVDVWRLSHAEFAEPAELESHAGSAEFLDLGFVNNGGQLRFVDNPDPTNLCFTAFSFTETNLFFTVAWPTNDSLPDSVLDLYGSTNLLDQRWLLLSSHPATNPPVEFFVERSSLPWIVNPALHVHDGSCESITNVVLSPLDGITVYTNVFWSCSTNRVPGDVAFFKLGTRHDTDGDGLFDALELLAFGTDPDVADTGDTPVGVDPEVWALSHPTWSTNYADADLAIGWYPLPSFRWGVYRVGNLFVSLADSTAPKYVRLPPGVSVPCSVSADGLVYFTYWSGGRHVEYAPGLDDPPLWYRNFSAVLDPPRPPGPAEVAVPVLTVEPVLGSGTTDRHVATNGSVCIHGGSPVQRFVWSVAPADIAIGRTPFATGDVRIDGEGPFVDLSGATSPRTGGFGFAAGSTVGGGNLAGVLTNAISAHLCDANPTNPLCSVCGCPDSQTYALISISQDYRYALFGTTNMSRFAATVQGGDTNDIVWTVSPGWGDCSKLHETSDPYSTGYVELSGTAQVWADSGFSTNVNTITASFSSGTNACATATFTSIAVDAEAVCNERATDGSVVNPICIPIGESAVFRARVFPESVPDPDLHWIVSGGHAGIAGSHYGREVAVAGTSTGEIQLDLVISGCNGPNPRFRVFVMPMRTVPVVAWITCNDVGTPVVSENRIGPLLDDANDLLRQVCVSCYVHQVSYTNCQDWLRLENYGSLDFLQKATEIVSVSNNVGGVEIHFVEEINGIAGLNTPGGIVLPAETSGRVLAHEIGHAFGLRDIYDEHDYAVGSVVGRVRKDRCQDDWTGNDDRGFYREADTLPQTELIRRLVMYGIDVPDSADFSWGNVEGLAKGQSNPDTITLQTVPVGVFPNGTPPNPHHE